jgi:hypothetical protein
MSRPACWVQRPQWPRSFGGWTRGASGVQFLNYFVRNLNAGINMHMFYHNLLLAFAAMVIERVEQHGKGDRWCRVRETLRAWSEQNHPADRNSRFMASRRGHRQNCVKIAYSLWLGFLPSFVTSAPGLAAKRSSRGQIGRLFCKPCGHTFCYPFEPGGSDNSAAARRSISATNSFMTYSGQS